MSKVYTEDEIVKALETNNIFYHREQNDRYYIKFGVTAIYHNELYVRLYDNGQYDFGKIYNGSFLLNDWADPSRFLPLKLFSQPKNHLPKWF
jgi:hypothetical protein